MDGQQASVGVVPDEQVSPLRRATTAEQAADGVRSLILRGSLEPGAPLRETQLAAAFGISRNTMREALRLLAREGIVIQDRHRVATVAPLGLDDVADIFAVRRLFELGAVDLLRERGRRASSLDLDVMRASVTVLERSAGTDWQSVIDADCAFHQALVALPESPRLSIGYGLMEAEIRRCMSVTTRVHRDQDELSDEHAELLGHLERGRFKRFGVRLGEILHSDEARVKRVLSGEDEPPLTPGRRPHAATAEPA